MTSQTVYLRPNPSALLITLLWIVGGFCLLDSVAGQDTTDEAIPGDTCILELSLPEGATVTIDGRDYGSQRRFEFKPLNPQKAYHSKLRIIFPGSTHEDHRLLLQAGVPVRLASAGPLANRPEIALQTGLAGVLLSAAVSPDGRYLLTSDTTDTDILWDINTGCQLRSYHFGGGNAVAFTPDGRFLLTGSTNGAVLWETASGKKVRIFEMPQGTFAGPEEIRPVYSVAFSPDGRQVAAGGMGQKMLGLKDIALWDAAMGKKLQTFSADFSAADIVSSLAFTPDGRRLLAGYHSQPAVLWDIATGKRLQTYGEPSDNSAAAAVSPDGRMVLTGSRDKLARLWDADTGQKLRTFEGHTFWVESVAFQAEGRQVLTCSRNEAIVWNVATGERLRTLKGLGLKLTTSHPPSRPLVIGSEPWGTQGGIVVWDPANERVQALPVHSVIPKSIAISGDGRHVLTATWTEGADALLWDTTVGRPIRTLPDFEKGSVAFVIGNILRRVGVKGGHTHFVDTGALSPDGRHALTGSLDKTAILWDVESGKQIRRLKGHNGRILSVAFSPDGQRAVTGSDDNTAIVWELNTGKPLRVLEARGIVASAVFISNNRHVLALAGTVGKAILWDIETGQQESVFEGGAPDIIQSVTSVAVSRDGRYAVGVSGYNTALWDLATRETVRVFRRAEQDIAACVAFSSDSKKVAVGYWDGTIALWDIVTGRQFQSFSGHTAGVTSLTFAEDGQKIATASEGDRSMRFWDVATGKEMIRLTGLDGGGEWLATTPEGLFDGSAGAREKVMFRVGGGLNVVPVDRFFQDFYYPGLLAAIWRGERPLPKVEMGQSLPPTVRIAGPQEAGMVDSPRVTVQVEAVDQGGGVRGPWLVHNGARVLAPGETEREGKLVTRRFDVALIEGDNRLEFHAASADGSWESEPAVITFLYDKPLPKPELHLLAVGINDYADDPLDLQFARADALAMAELFRQRGPVLYPNVRVTSLLDKEATGPAVLGAIREVAQRARPQDTVVVFLAGHGTVVGQQYYFLPREFHRQAERLDEDVQSQGIWAGQIRDWMETVPALKRMLVFDTGQSGGPMGLTRTARDPFAFRGAVERLSRATGTYIIAAAAVSEEAKEVPELGHGVLSYTLLAGLHAAGGGPLEGQWIEPSSSDRVAHALEWFGFASAQVPQLTKRYFGREQDVQHSIAGMSFPVLPVPQSAEVPRVDAAPPSSPVIRAEPPRVEPGVGEPKLHLVAVGINRYTEEAMNLELARGDAEAMAELFRGRGGGTYRETHTNLVLDERATKAGIVEAIEKLAGLADPEDTLAVFLAGHGKMVGQRYYFIPHVFRRRADDLEEDIREQGLPADVLADAISKVPARKRILILDTCASGGALRLSRQGQDPFAFRGAIEKLGERQGVFTIAASGAGEESQEIEELGHGVLTYALLAGLRAVRPGGPLEGLAIHPTSTDGRVDVLEWFSFAAGHVPRLTKSYLGHAQEVHIGGQGTSFAVLAVAEPELRSVEEDN